MDELLVNPDRVARLLKAAWRMMSATENFLGILVLLAIAATIERARGGDVRRRYLSSCFATDLAYTVFIQAGLYTLIVQNPIMGPIDAARRQHLPWLELNLLASLPTALQFVLYTLIADLVYYWAHRLLHASRLLWSIHSLHHSQERLNLLTAYRFHWLEMLYTGLTLMLPALLLGFPASVWAPVLIAQNLFGVAQHMGVDWTLGPLERVFVSGRFHAVHHSNEPAEHDKNFGNILSVWDVLFGTARFAPSLPRRYGVSEPRVPESFFVQLVYPFLDMARVALAALGRRGSADARRAS